MRVIILSRPTMGLLTAVMLGAAYSQAAPLTAGGPGGAGTTNGSSSLKLWLKADTLVQANNTPVSSWTDSSGSGNTVTSSGSAQPTYMTSLVNSRPGVRFDGTDDVLQTVADPASLQLTTGNIYVVGHMRSTGFMGAVTYIRDYGVGTKGYWFGERNGAAWLLADSTSSPNYQEQTGLLNWPVNSPRIVALRFDGANVTTRSSGTQIGTLAQTRTPTYQAGDRLLIGKRDNATANFSPLEISEAIVFNTGLNTAQQSIVENHLSSKYDLAISGEHYNGDTGAKGDFDFDVFGIGRVNVGNQVTSAGMAGFGLEAAGALADNTWALAGHDNGPNGVTTADVPTDLYRWERSFYIDTDNIASANLAFDWNDAGVTATFEAGLNRLFFRSVNSGPFTLLATGTVDIGNQRVDFSNVTLSDGYYVLAGATPVPEPSTLALCRLGIVGMAIQFRRRRTAG